MPAGDVEGVAGALEKGWADAGRALPCFAKLVEKYCMSMSMRVGVQVLLGRMDSRLPVLSRRSEDPGRITTLFVPKGRLDSCV